MTNRWFNRIYPLARVAFDSNALIYHLEHAQPYAPLVRLALSRIQSGQAVGILSTLVESELLIKPLRENDSLSIRRIELFFSHTANLRFKSVDRAVARRAAAVRARTGLSLADAIIAATAIEERCDAIIGNDARLASRITGVPYLYLADYLE